MEMRQATMADLDAIMALYDTARAFMRKNGNMSQWINGYPSRALLTADIAAGTCHVEAEGDVIHGVFVCIVGEDPTYGYIEDGHWLNDRPYAAIHRVGSDGAVPGFLGRCVAYCRRICPELRMDTHADNRAMRQAAERQGFHRCGRIYVEDGSPREAYQLPSEPLEKGK